MRTKGSKNKPKPVEKETKKFLPKKTDTACKCEHSESIHYGTEKEPNKTWCNTPNCRCEHFQ